MESGEMDTGGSSGHVGETQHLSELRIVLVGAEVCGKSSAGNTILGKQVFAPGIKTLEGKKVQATIDGRQVTVVDTPGWICYFPVEDSPELLKDQILWSVSLCPPGPHAFLLFINLDSSFQEKHRIAVQEHLELLGETVWRHTILLFSFGDTLREMTIKHLIEGQALQMLLEKCGNRYYVLSNKNSSGVSQVSELLEMIEKMVAGNGGCHFHMGRKLLQDMEEKRRITEERANQRVRKVLEHRVTLQRLLRGDATRPPELRMVLLGWVAGGKSSTGNTILGREKLGVWKRTAQCEKKQGEVNGRQVTVVDTPGWWKYLLTPDWIKEEAMKGLTVCDLGPHAILLVIPADTSFKEKQRKIIRENMKHLGERVWGHTLVLFTWGESLGNHTIEQHIEREGQALQWLIEKCGNRFHVLSNKERGDSTQVTELLEKIEEMVAGRTVLPLKTETQSEVMEEIDEKDGVTRGVDFSTDTQKVTELMKIFDELWVKREQHLLEQLGLDSKQRSEVRHPADMLKLFEKEWSRTETGLKLKKMIQECTTTHNEGDILCGSKSLEEGSTLTEAANKTRAQQWIEREDAAFEKEWGRREWMMFNHFKRMMQDTATQPVRGVGSMHEPPDLCAEIFSEPDTSHLARTCIKVYDWMSETHHGNSAAASGYETNSEISNTEASDITERDKGLEHCGTADA
ncbi:GTPase IMAP family member 8-like isoform X3 [Conger conger]|nr:GTPase IMAP family member 8-like isoform X3 [Conger conger]